MKTYLITGGAGFIGSNYIEQMLSHEQDAHVVNVDLLTYPNIEQNMSGFADNPRYDFFCADICDATRMAELFTTYDFNTVIHFAAESHVDTSIINPSRFMQTNVIGTQTLLDCARASWEKSGGYTQKKFVQVSTDEVYGTLGLDGCFTEESVVAPRSPYSASKAAGDLLALAYYNTYGLPVAVTRCSNNYGKHQYPEKLIPVVIEAAYSHSTIPLYGDGSNVRDWLHVSDHCSAISLVAELGKPGEVYNIGAQNEISNKELVSHIIGMLSKKYDASIDDALIEYVPDRLGHDFRYAIDSSKIARELGWTPRVSFEQGLEDTIDWYMTHKGWFKD